MINGYNNVTQLLAMLRGLRARHDLEGMMLPAYGWEMLLDEIDRLQAPPRPASTSPELVATAHEANHRVDAAIEKLNNANGERGK